MDHRRYARQARTGLLEGTNGEVMDHSGKSEVDGLESPSTWIEARRAAEILVFPDRKMLIFNDHARGMSVAYPQLSS
jgi:hypothetical protein